MKTFTFMLSLILLAAGLVPSATRATTKPNIVLIMLDDLNSSPGCYGGQALTPNIDKLASEGTRFDNAACQFTLCSPSRTSMLTGLRPSTLGLYGNDDQPPTRLTFPEYFSSHGYFTASIGKIAHEGWPDTAKWDFRETASEIGDTVTPSPAAKDKQLVDGRITKRVIKQIRKSRNKQFLIAAGFTLPHAPTISPQKYLNLYREQDILLAAPGPDGMTSSERRRARLEYYACVSFIDAQIGLILAELDRQGLRENTIVVFTSDHGYLTGEHGIWDKKNLYIQTMEVPFIIAGAGLRGVSSPAIVELLDLFPTLADLCGLPPPPVEGRSLVPLLHEPLQPWSEFSITQTIQNKNSPVDTAVRTDRYTYIERNGVGITLYDRLLDPEEMVNQIDNPDYNSTTAQMQTRLR